MVSWPVRLTLRTLLAYLNQSNLNLRAIERIEAKVRQSPAATKLIEELRRITTDPTIAALTPDSEEGSRDANSVAEYLDNALAEVQVEAFEKQAFESNYLLSEIAGCHEILSAICRNETTIAQAALRQRAYELGRVSLDHASVADVADVQYLGTTTKSAAPPHSIAHQFVDDLQRAEVEFRLGPPPEESHRHDEWADAISSEEFVELHRRQQMRLPLALFATSLILLALAIWLIVRGLSY